MRGKRILVVNPPAPYNRFRERSHKYLRVPVGVVSLTTFLLEKGVDARMLDMEAEGFPGLEKALSEFSPEIVGIATYTTSVHEVARICAVAKRAGAKVVLGGYHASAVGKGVFSETGCDYAINGEAETPLLGLCLGRKLEKIPGLLYLKGNSVKGDAKIFLEEPNNFSVPDYSLVPNRRYVENYDNSISLAASRGCPYSCNFCAIHITKGKRWRAIPPDKLVSGLKRAAESGRKSIVFHDSEFGLDRKWLRSFCGLMKKTGLSKRLKWGCMKRLDNLSFSEMRLMREAGCVSVWTGIESGSDRVLGLMNKGTDSEKIGKFVSLARKAGLEVGAFIILGYPGETEEDRKMTRDLIFRLCPDEINVYFFVPFIGTGATGKAPEFLKKDTLYDMYAETSGNGGVRSRKNLENLLKWKREIYGYYFAPRKLIHELSKIRSPAKLYDRTLFYSGLVLSWLFRRG